MRNLCHLLSLLLLLATQAHAATYQVSPTGSDSTPCPQAQQPQTPRRTINGGIACLGAGDTLVVHPGDYDEFLTNYPGIGYGSVPIPSGVTIQAAQPGTVTLRTTQHPHGWNAVLAFGPASADITIAGLRLVSDWSLEEGINLHDAQRIHFRDVEITAMKGQGLQGQCTGCTFTNMDVHAIARRNGQTTCGAYVCGESVRDANGMCPGYCHGIYLAGTQNVIDGGRWHDIDGYGIHLYPAISSSTIRNACVWGNGSAGIGLFSGEGNALERVRVWGNVGPGIWVQTRNSTLDNSQASGNQGGDLVDSSGGTLTVRNTQLGGASLVTTDCGAVSPPVVPAPPVLPAPTNLHRLTVLP